MLSELIHHLIDFYQEKGNDVFAVYLWQSTVTVCLDLRFMFQYCAGLYEVRFDSGLDFSQKN